MVAADARASIGDHPSYWSPGTYVRSKLQNSLRHRAARAVRWATPCSSQVALMTPHQMPSLAVLICGAAIPNEGWIHGRSFIQLTLAASSRELNPSWRNDLVECVWLPSYTSVPATTGGHNLPYHQFCRHCSTGEILIARLELRHRFQAKSFARISVQRSFCPRADDGLTVCEKAITAHTTTHLSHPLRPLANPAAQWKPTAAPRRRSAVRRVSHGHHTSP